MLNLADVQGTPSLPNTVCDCSLEIVMRDYGIVSRNLVSIAVGYDPKLTRAPRFFERTCRQVGWPVIWVNPELLVYRLM